MELVAHILIGRQIADAFMLEGALRKAFLFGCIEPDCAMVTYLRGFSRGKGIHGHNWENIVPCIIDLIGKCSGGGILFAFRFGRLCHYLADSFTHPHNASFKGTLSEHMDYEHELTMYLRENMGNLRFPPERGFSFSWIEALHDEYLSGGPSVSRDAFYALRACYRAAYALAGSREGEAVLA